MEIDVANNIRAVELLKVELLQNIANFFGDMSAEADSETAKRITDDAADIIIMTRLLCRRLGIDWTAVRDAMCKKLKAEVGRGHILERRFGDLSAVLSEVGEEERYNEKYEG